MTGTAITLWTVRAACVLYVLGLAGWLTRAGRLARWAWTLGCAMYLAHVAAAFQFYHEWSHAAAVRETARQTAELFGVASGNGVYFNYVFTGVWVSDVLWWWLSPDGYRRRPKWVTASVHGFMAFMFFNATVVFASGWVRGLGVAATVVLGSLCWRRSIGGCR